MTEPAFAGTRGNDEVAPIAVMVALPNRCVSRLDGAICPVKQSIVENLSRVFTAVVRIRRRINKCLRRYWYEAIYLWPAYRQFNTINNGYWPPDNDIAEEFPIEGNQIQLYAELLKVGGVDLPGLQQRALLEVGAGRGGGLLFLSRKAAPRVLVGVEQSFFAVCHGRRRGLDLRRGVAERLPFDDQTSDYVLCVDSINLLSDPGRSLLEMRRVLSPYGMILLGDFILGSTEAARGRLDHWALTAGLSILAFRDATSNVQDSIREDQPRNLGLLQRVPRLLRRFGVEALTLQGSKRYERWVTGAYRYYLAALIPTGIGNDSFD